MKAKEFFFPRFARNDRRYAPLRRGLRFGSVTMYHSDSTSRPTPEELPTALQQQGRRPLVDLPIQWLER